MKKIIVLISSISFLTGCAGINSDFEFNKPAKDSGYWLQQADEMTSPDNLSKGNKNTENLGGSVGHIDVSRYKLVDTGNILLPVKTVNSTPISVITASKGSVDKTSAETDTQDPLNSAVMNICTDKYCYPEPNSPFRRSESVSRLWIAPYLSPDNHVHLGEIMFYIAKKASWSGVQ